MGTGTLRSVPGAAAGCVRQGLGLLFFFLSSIEAGWASGPGWEAAPLRSEKQSHPFTCQVLRAAKEDPGTFQLSLHTRQDLCPLICPVWARPNASACCWGHGSVFEGLFEPTQVPTCPPAPPERAESGRILQRLLEFPAPWLRGWSWQGKCGGRDRQWR